MNTHEKYKLVRRLAAKKGAITRKILTIYSTGKSEAHATALAELEKLRRYAADDIRDAKALKETK